LVRPNSTPDSPERRATTINDMTTTEQTTWSKPRNGFKCFKVITTNAERVRKSRKFAKNLQQVHSWLSFPGKEFFVISGSKNLTTGKIKVDCIERVVSPSH